MYERPSPRGPVRCMTSTRPGYSAASSSAIAPVPSGDRRRRPAAGSPRARARRARAPAGCRARCRSGRRRGRRGVALTTADRPVMAAAATMKRRIDHWEIRNRSCGKNTRHISDRRTSQQKQSRRAARRCATRRMPRQRRRQHAADTTRSTRIDTSASVAIRRADRHDRVERFAQLEQQPAHRVRARSTPARRDSRSAPSAPR